MLKKIFFSSLFLCITFSISLPEQANAVSAGASVHVYSIPGIYAEDIPEGWIAHTHLRYLYFGKAYNNNGDLKDAGMDFSATEVFAKVAHVSRFGENDKWQYTSIAIIPVLNMTAKLDNGSTISASGMGDPLWSNYVGTWWNDHNSHAGIGVTVTAPIGDYHKDNELNLGSNHWTVFFPYIHGQFKYMAGNGVLMFEPYMNIEWRFENPDTNFKDHDVSEWGFMLTYFPSNDYKVGFFIKPNYQFAIDNSSGDPSGHQLSGIHDDKFYSAAAAAGVTWNISSKENVSLTWTSNFAGKGYDGGAPSPQLNDIHFVWSHVF